MRAGPLSNAKVVEMVNSYFVPVYTSNEDYRKEGVAPAEEKAEYQRIYREALKAKLSTGTVHVYIVTPDGHPVDSLHVATASQVDKLLDLLQRNQAKFKTPAGKTLVKPAPQSAAPAATADDLVLHVTSRYLLRKGKELVPLKEEARLGQTRHASWSALPSENWVVLSGPEGKKLVTPAKLEIGTSWELDKSVAAKVLTYFYPQTENNDIKKNRIDELTMTAKVVSLKEGVARVRLEGSLKMKHPFYHKDDENFVQASVLGYLDYEVGKQRIRSLRLATETATYRKQPFGVAVRSLP
jgi:hypothetical protein